MADGSNDALILQMSVDMRRMEKSLQALRGMTDRQLKGVESRFDRMNSHVKRSGDTMARDLRSSIAAIGIGVAINQVTDYADAWTTARNKLAAAGVEQGNLATTMQQIVDLSKETGSSFEATADLYAKVQRNAAKLGLTQADVLKLTEQVNKAFVAGGAAAGEQAAGILQLGQALGSGVLQGDELKSIRENAPLLAQAIADEFKTTIAGLKKLGADGELTSDRVAKAIIRANGIQEQFAATTRTVAQSVENLRTEFTRYIAQSRVAQTVVQTLSGFLQFVTNNLDAFADAALVAASVIGGTLAVAALGRFIVSLTATARSIATAATAMQRLRLAMTFLGGPIGAAVLGIAAAVATLAFNSDDAAGSIDSARQALEAMQATQAKIDEDTRKLKSAQDALTEAMRTQGVVAQNTARQEVQAIDDRIKANNKLLATQRLAVVNQLQQLELQDKPASGPVAHFQRVFGAGTIGDKRAELDRLMSDMNLFRGSDVVDQYRNYLNDTSRRRGFTDIERQMSDLLTEIDAFEQEKADLKKQLQSLDAHLSLEQQDVSTDLDRSFAAVRGGDEAIGGDVGASGANKASEAAKGYRTEAEKLTSTLDGLRKAQEADNQALNDAAQALDQINEMRRRASQYGVAAGVATTDNEMISSIEAKKVFEKTPEQDTAAFDAINQRVAEAAAERSRVALQAILDFAEKDLPGAFAKIPSFADILTREDAATLRTKLGEMAKTASDAILEGTDKLVADAEKQIIAIEQARAAAVAAGITDLSKFDRAAMTVLQNLQDGLDEALDVPVPYNVDELLKDLPELPDFVDELAGFREGVRNGVREGLREGIQTDDWGQAMRNAIAEWVTTGFEESLNAFADALTDILTGRNPMANAIFSQIGSFFGFGRASGGPVYGGQTVMVGENGPEILRMGGGQKGQVLNASMTRDLLSRSGGGSSIYAPLIVQGSIDAVTWPKVEAAMRAQAQQIMAAVPTAVDGKLIYNRRQKRRL